MTCDVSGDNGYKCSLLPSWTAVINTRVNTKAVHTHTHTLHEETLTSNELPIYWEPDRACHRRSETLTPAIKKVVERVFFIEKQMIKTVFNIRFMNTVNFKQKLWIFFSNLLSVLGVYIFINPFSV